jgi:hypothetical protein
VKIGRSRIETGLHPERAATLELFNQLALDEQFFRPALDAVKRGSEIDHENLRFTF